MTGRAREEFPQKPHYKNWSEVLRLFGPAILSVGHGHNPLAL